METVVLEKGTSGYGQDHRKLWMPIVKDAGCETGYMAVLTDNSLDRDEEIIGKSALNDFIDKDDYLAGLMDHENKILNQVCTWINRRLVTIDGHDAVIAEPKFFKSNPNAKILMGMLDEGAQMGVSIGAIVKEHVDRKIAGKTYKEYTRVEPVEASFVSVPANKHAHAIAINKSLKPKQTEVQPTMDKTYSQVEFDEISKKFEAEKAEIAKQLAEAVEKGELLKAAETEKADLAKKLEAAATEKAELEKKIAAFVEKENKVTLMKGADVGLPGNHNSETVEEALKANKVLVMRRAQ